MLARLQLIRPLNLLFIVLGQIALLIHLITDTEFVQSFYLIFSTLLSAAAGYVINDIFDRKTDAINRPKRPLVSGKISLTHALVFYFTLLFCSLLIAYLAQIQGLVLIVLIINIALFLYAWYVKRTAIIGNLLVSACVGSVFVLCNILIDEPSPIASGLGVFATAATFLRENYKSIEDIKGDKEAGYRTLPVLLGIERSMWFTGILSILFGSILLYRFNLPIATGISSFTWAIITLSGGAFFIGIGIYSLLKPNIDTAHKGSLSSKIMMSFITLMIFAL